MFLEILNRISEAAIARVNMNATIIILDNRKIIISIILWHYLLICNMVNFIFNNRLRK